MDCKRKTINYSGPVDGTLSEILWLFPPFPGCATKSGTEVLLAFHPEIVVIVVLKEEVRTEDLRS